MSVYDPDRVCAKGVGLSEGGITFGFCSLRFYSLVDILSIKPLNLNSEILLECGVGRWRVWYPHLIFRVLAVHGVSIANNSKPELRYKLLQELTKQTLRKSV